MSTSDSLALRIERATEAHVAPVVELFARSDCPCYCQYYGFSGDHRDWQDRCANEKEANRAGLAADLATARTTALVALSQQRAVGWVRIEQPDVMHKTYQGRLYRDLPCFSGDRSRVWGVACFLVDPSARRLGVAAALLDAALALARARGARALEAFPRGARDVSDEEQWTGPLSLYERAGFRVVRDFEPYPVLRLEW